MPSKVGRTIHPFWIIIGWSLLVHLPGITSPLLDYHAFRQCQTASVARNYVRHGMHFLSPEIDTAGPPVRTGTEFPLYSYLLAVLFKLFGTHEILGRLLSIAFAAWGAIFLYLFVRPRVGDRIALWSALVMCAIPVHVYFTRSVQPEPMALWGLLGFLYYGDRWLNRYGRYPTWVLALLLGSLAPLLKLPYMYVLLPLWFFLGYERYGLQALKTASWLILAGLMLTATAAWYHYAKTAPVVLLPLTTQEHLANLTPILTRRLWQAQFVSRIPELVITYSGLLFSLIGFYYYRKAKFFRFLIGWMLSCALYVVLLGEYGLIHRYTLLPLAPAAAISIAFGIVAFWEHAKKHPVAKALGVIVILGIPLHAGLRIKHWYRVEYSYLTRAHDKLAEVSQPNDLVLVVNREKPEILYYLDRYGYSMDPVEWRAEDVKEMLARNIRYVFIPKQDARQRLGEWKTILARRTQLVLEDPEFLLYRIVPAALSPPRHG